ncbi:type B 50S ribosomal protein L31 [Streptomyces griseorubiginosus]|uniref:type B 50S ribosomal protein L31 n=1 Tax=Streptomyces griseorubiginosus TaxID=67304 RepID=UPI002E7FF154|nr:type B 50S ribosomal protein L31 [Streptomyces griseorubiginosus]WUB42042.1 type B 50S ribosomal protein L31 [Streptomyces griseorubiginosus]WUB50561.1 type B 50S ribosomal protein L31 [Streptomyces griseorubiginosus]
MRSSIHPVSRPVVFRDRAAGFQLLIRSTLDAQDTVVWADGSTYPVVDVDVSSASHPFYTGTSRIVDTAGRVERFERRYGRTAPVRP